MAFLQRLIQGEAKEIVQILPGTLRIGRGEKNELRLSLASVSKTHAKIECFASHCEVSDLNSRNGTLFNGIRIDRSHRLRDGDILDFAGAKFVYLDSNSSIAGIMDDSDFEFADDSSSSPFTISTFESDCAIAGIMDDSHPRPRDGNYIQGLQIQEITVPPDDDADPPVSTSNDSVHLSDLNESLEKTLQKIRDALKRRRTIRFSGKQEGTVKAALIERDQLIFDTLGSGFHRLIIFDAGAGMVDIERFDVARFENHILLEMTRTLGYAFRNNRFHPAEIAQFLTDEEPCLFCFVNIACLTEEAFRIIRGVGFLHSRHSILYVGRHPYLDARKDDLI